MGMITHIVGTKTGEKFMETSSPNRDILYNQIEEMYGKVMYSYTTQVIHAGRLYRRNKLLKWGQLILSAISTGGIIGNLITKCDSFAWIGGIFSTILLVLTAYFKDNEFSNLHQRHLNTSNQLWMMREKYLSLLYVLCTIPFYLQRSVQYFQKPVQRLCAAPV